MTNHTFSPPETFTLKARRIGIEAHKRLLIYMRADCPICKSEGFRSEARLKISLGNHWIIATLDVVTSDILAIDELGLSEAAWEKLNPKEGEALTLAHSETLESFKYVRAKLFGKSFTDTNLKTIMHDMMEGRYSEIQISSFITACVDLSRKETLSLTKTMSEAGRQLKWNQSRIVDKHCVGGIPGNRTTMIVVPIIAAYGLTIPKTSSRAITSPSGTADTMEVLAPVTLSVEGMKKVVEQEGGCIIWGGSVDLSPVDDILVQVERALDLDSSKQLVASVLSKKIAAGSTDVLIDMPVGPTAKVRSKKNADYLRLLFHSIGEAMNLNIQVVTTDVLQPVGRGIGPVLEARDVLSVLRCEKNAPQDLRERSLFLVAKILAHCCDLPFIEAYIEAEKILNEGLALKKFEAICNAQGGMREPILAPFTYEILAEEKGIITNIDNRLIARVAKFAGAPDSPQAGVDFYAPLGTPVEKGQPLFTIYSSSKGELDYALRYYQSHQEVIEIGETIP